MMVNEAGNWQENADGTWSTAVPLPFYGLLKRCECGQKFWRTERYIKHYQQRHTNGVRYQRTSEGLVAQDRRLA